jgi:riboflavin biosynthesis pyrimidine reductase
MSVVAELADQGLVHEYRLLAFPTILGAGHGLFRGRRELTLVSSEHVGPAILAVLTPEPPERS